MIVISAKILITLYLSDSNVLQTNIRNEDMAHKDMYSVRKTTLYNVCNQPKKQETVRNRVLNYLEMCLAVIY